MAWNRGYVADAPYTGGFYRDTAPGHMALAALMAGITPPDPSGPFRYLELGCGTGLSLATLAAANPQAEFVGVDFMPAHIAAARRLAGRAGLRNIQFVEAAFGDLADGEADLGTFDFAALHGVYTWVSREVQQEIVRLLAKALAPGALLYAGYNNMAGFHGMVAGQKLLFEYASRGSGDSSARLRGALQKLIDLHGAKAASFDVSMLPAALQGPEASPDRLSLPLQIYLAHEYLAEHWRPLFISDVAADFAEAKLQFAGRSHLLETLTELVLTDAQADSLSDPADVILTELEADAMAPSAFRRDLFVRGAMRLSPGLREARLMETEIALVTGNEAIPMQLNVRTNKLDLDEAVYGPIIQRLREGAAKVGDLTGLVAAKGGRIAPAELLAVLEGCGAVAPVTRTGGDIEAIRRFNVAAVESYREQAVAHFSLVSGLTGGGVDQPLPNCLAYLLAVGEEKRLAGLDVESLRALASELEPFWRAHQML